ncbi:cysteine--tRNA ligase [Candidatus Woesebacteria bacterium]|nr:cysteine--tRNA ligase [Candidatus Woesebacteria bacterium]
MKIYNSLGSKIEEFEPLEEGIVKVYTCGPTVYNYASIGNFRTYLAADILIRTLKYSSYDVKYVMNLTDVGHLTGDNLGDADTGEDRIEKEAKKEGKSAWDISKFYIDAFIKDYERLNLTKPELFAKATDHIKEQIELVRRIEQKGFTYKTSDGIYFDTKRYEQETGRKYGELSTLDKIKEGARVEVNNEKQNPEDFALWKFSPSSEKRQMEWDSPWGVGFPGWHIECSAMSMKYLGESFDFHVGGEDLRQTHHPNEIAQAESVTGKTFVKYWMHVTFLKVDGKKMSKSLGNVYRIDDIVDKGYDPLALRYLFMTSHYRDSINFTWDALEAADTTLKKLRKLTMQYRNETRRVTLSEEKRQKIENYSQEFGSHVENDLDTPKAIATMWKILKSNIPSIDKYDLLLDFDEIFGLNLRGLEGVEIPKEIIELAEKRMQLRNEGEYEESDKVREEIQKRGFNVKDRNGGYDIEKV